MRQTTLWLVIAAGLIVAYALYHYWNGSQNLEVEPHAAGEIEKAQRR